MLLKDTAKAVGQPRASMHLNPTTGYEPAIVMQMRLQLQQASRKKAECCFQGAEKSSGWRCKAAAQVAIPDLAFPTINSARCP